MQHKISSHITDLLTNEHFIVLANRQIAEGIFDIDPFLALWPDREDDIRLAFSFIKNIHIQESPYPILLTPDYVRESRNEMLRKAHMARRVKTRSNTKSFFAIAATFLIAIGLTLFFVDKPAKDVDAPVFTEMIPQDESVRIIVDDNQGVVLAHADNEAIEVNTDGSVMVGNREVIAKKNRPEISTSQILVPFGKRTKIVLPDSSSLWINSGTKVVFRSDFKQNRKLIVEGEVFIDVKKDEKRPFVVKTDHMEVEVLGTAFNVSDFKGQAESSVVLVRGKVNVKAGEKTATLAPNQKLDLENSTGQATVESGVNIYQYTCWIDDVMNFRDESLEHIFNTLATYYNVKIHLNADLKSVLCTGSLDLNYTIEELLEMISMITPLSFQIENDEIIIDKQN
ncbi:MAG: FecR family protein [Bacteroidales bacterium]